jgi:hypothetical protein
MPRCLEKKLLLSGDVHTYACELVRFEQGFGMLKYVLDSEYTVGGIKLLPGDVTCALYWEDRPYTLYTWDLKRENGVVYYFNIADFVLLRPDEFTWRDLVVDILLDATGHARVLDEHELPPGLDSTISDYIHDAKEHILAHSWEIVEEAKLLITTNCHE